MDCLCGHTINQHHSSGGCSLTVVIPPEGNLKMAREEGILDRLRNFPVASLFLIFIMGLLGFQVLSYLLSLVYPPAQQVKLGWVLLLIAVAASVAASYTIIRNRIAGNVPFTRGDVLILLLIVGGTTFLLIKLPILVPQVFSVASLQLQSVLGLG